MPIACKFGCTGRLSSWQRNIVGGGATFSDWQKRAFDRNAVIADPLFVDPTHDNYTLRPESPAFQLGFEPIDASTVGRSSERCRCPIRPAAPEFGLVAPSTDLT